MKTVFITGATSGIGEATAKRFLKEGWNVIACGRREERLAALTQTMLDSRISDGDNVQTLVLDVTDRAAVDKAVAQLPAIDLLVNNAGLAWGLEKADDADMEKWDRMVATNISALIHLTRALLPGMVARGQGHIINLGSVAGTYPYPGGNVYGATKAFVKQFSLNLRADLVDKNIRVTNIEPGLCETEFSLVRFSGDAKAAKDVYKGTTPLSGDDVAEAIYWAASLPAHVNINSIELMPTAQAFAPFAVHRD